GIRDKLVTGVQTCALPISDVLKLLLAGADVTMLASALFQNGPGHLRTLLHGIRSWLEEKEYVSVAQMKGSLSQKNCPDPAAFEQIGRASCRERGWIAVGEG